MQPPNEGLHHVPPPPSAAVAQARAYESYGQHYTDPFQDSNEFPVPLYSTGVFPGSATGVATAPDHVVGLDPPFSSHPGAGTSTSVYTPFLQPLPSSLPLAHISPADLAPSTAFGSFAQPFPPPAPGAHDVAPFDLTSRDPLQDVHTAFPPGQQVGGPALGEDPLRPLTADSTAALLPPPTGTTRRRTSYGGEVEAGGGSLRGVGAAGHGRGKGHTRTSSASASGSATVAAAGSGGGAQRASVSALAAAVGTRTTEKSCKNCRVRKVKCDRKWPRCNRCKDRDDECDFGTFVPVDTIPEEALASATSSPGIAALQARITELEQELAVLRTDPPTSGPLALRSSVVQNTGYGAPPSAVGASSGSSIDTVGAWSDQSGLAGAPFTGHPRLGTQALEELSRDVPLSEAIHDVFSRGAGLTRPGSQANKSTVEIFLRGAALQDPALYAAASAGLGPLPGPSMTGSGSQISTPLPPPPREDDPNWQLAKSAMARMLVVHLVQSFFASCCAYLPAFDSWHPRRTWILHNLDNLDPASRVSVAAFCAMGARASQHSAILGITMPEPSPVDWYEQTSAAGVRREQACRALHSQALDLAHLLGITYDANRENLEALLVVTQMLMFNELVPRRSRAIVHTAIGQYKELQEGAASASQKRDTLKHIGLPLLACDALTSATAHKRPLVSPAELEQHFPSLLPIDPLHDDIQVRLQRCLDDHLTPDGRLSHTGIIECTHIVNAWLVQTERLFAQAAAPMLGGPPMSLIDDIRNVWLLLDQIHEGMRRMQELLVHLGYTPAGCARDRCADQHLRFITRLDLDLLNCFFLVHALVTENLGLDHLKGDNAQLVYSESDKHVRKALKLIAFYLEIYITSRDPHLTYHVVWQLELVPKWTTTVVQRFGEPDGPPTAELEVSETELDWLDKGLVCASYYHPVANSRLHELRANRRASPAAQQSAHGHAAPHPAPLPPHAPPHATGPLALPVPTTDARAHGGAMCFPPSTTYLAGDEENGEGTGMPFQMGVTDPAHMRPWGMWSGKEGGGMTG
ncbi:hypothetical protein DMC30DRAFT_436746 [Rhodotorula diobovata]|uniref:Zn(2)-C6 fungal-type domain-containing protein n=1 Tax=Rhodotorula diobovata TaxID=5288 RepID=A0A5C5FWZ1_9BASI|nr:hypothetical protein DMC30DRAFT_436746 [Rhodotorula diobovata]